MSPTVCIVTAPQDRQVYGVKAALAKRGARVIVLNPADFPGQAVLVSRLEVGRGHRGRLRLEAGEVWMDDVRSIWYRRPELPAPPQPGAIAELVKRETVSALSGVLGACDAFWLPARPYLIRRAELKIEQLHAAASVGLEVPPTLVSNDPSAVLEFYNAHNGDIVSKAVDGTSCMRGIPGFSRYTERVGSGDLVFVDRVRNCPTLFQAYVPKRSEIRATVVGERVFSAEIDSQRSRHTQVDWRRYDLAHTPHRPHILPAELVGRCLRLLKHFGLSYGAFDFVLTPDGRYVFLEVNPNGQYGWIQDLVGLPIDEAIADLLLAGGSRGAVPVEVAESAV
jgi:hypothetical protein